MKVLYLPEVELYLFDLIEILYEEDYFGFPENAVMYVEKLKQFIENTLTSSIQGKKPNAPAYFSQYGENMSYITYRANKRTQWYILFQQHKDICLVRYITNNHRDAQFFNTKYI